MSRGCVILLAVVAWLGSTPPVAADAATWFPRVASTGGVGLAELDATRTWMQFTAPPPRRLANQEDPHGAAAAAVVSVPPAPSSLALALTAFATIGLLQTGRALSRVHLHGVVPEWYHTGGPAQVGHATPLDLQCGALIVDGLALLNRAARSVDGTWIEPTESPPPRVGVAPWLARGPPTTS
jgi:hypothetical protein